MQIKLLINDVVKENVLGLPILVRGCLTSISFCMSMSIALIQVFLEPTPMACSAAMGIVMKFDIMYAGFFLFELWRLSGSLCSKCSSPRAKMSVVCAVGLSLANSSE